MATLALAAAGAMMGSGFAGIAGMTGAQLGWMAGSMLGSYLFAPDMGDQHGPRLEDIGVTTGAEGKDIPFVMGTHILAGTVIAADEIKEHAKKEDVGKGGGGGSYTTYTYTCTFAISLGEFESKGPLKILLNKRPVFDETQKLDPTALETPVMTNEEVTWYFYDGTQTEPSSVLEEIYGIGNVPAYTGQTIIIFEDLLLTEYGQRIPSVEVVISTEEDKTSTTLEHPYGDVLRNGYGSSDYDIGLITNVGNDTVTHWYSEATGLFYFLWGLGAGADRWFFFLSFDAVTHDFVTLEIPGMPYGGANSFSLLSSYGKALGYNDLMIGEYNDGVTAGWAIWSIPNLQVQQVFSRDGIDQADFDPALISTFETETHFYGYDQNFYVYPKNPVLQDEWWWFDEDDLPAIYDYQYLTRSVITKPDYNNDTVTLVLYKSHTPYEAFLVDVTKTTLVGGYTRRYNITTSNERLITTGDSCAFPGLVENNSSYAFNVWAVRGSGNKFIWDPELGIASGVSGIDNSDYVSVEGDWWYWGLDIDTAEIVFAKGIGAITPNPWGAVSCSNRPHVYFSRGGRLWATATTGSKLQYYNIDTGYWQPPVLCDHTTCQAVYHVPTATFVAVGQAANEDPFVVQTRLENTPGEFSIGDMCENLAERAGIANSLIDKTGLVGKTVPGFVHSRVTSARGDMEPLLTYAQTDAYIHNGKLAFKVRGGIAEGTIPYSSLGAKEGKYPDEQPYKQGLPESIDAPLYFSLQYLSIENDFQAGLAIVNHPLSITKQHRQHSLPLLLHDDKAMEFVDKVLQQDIEKGTLEFAIIDEYIEIEPTDIWIIELEDARTVRVRIISITTGADGLMKVKAVRDYAEHQSSYAVAGGSVGNVFKIPYSGKPQLYLLDLPLLLDTEADQCSPYIVADSSGENYSIVIVSRTLEGTTNYQDITNLPVEGFIGGVQGVPTDHTSLDDKDIINSLKVNLRNLSTNSLATVTEAEALAGANAFAWGVNGRFEICTAQTVVSDGNGTYTLSNLFRGRKGTGSYINVHAAGDSFILLDQDTMGKDNIPYSMLDSVLMYRGVPVNQLSADYYGIQYTVSNTPLLPYAPVGLTTVEDNSTDQNLTLTAVRRRRKNGTIGGSNNFTDGIGTDPEITGYTLEIYDVNDVLRRTETLGTGAILFVYSKADQITDFGVLPYTVKWKISPTNNLTEAGQVWSDWYVYERPRIPVFSTTYDAFYESDADLVIRPYVTYPTGI